MGALIDIQDIEAALGREVEDPTEEAEWNFYINTLSDFINGYVDVAFEPLVDVTERFKADYYGQVKLNGPVRSITSVKNIRTGEEDQWVDFDPGSGMLYYLEPNQTVLVTYSYGHNIVPDDIQNLIVAAILDQIQEIAPVSLRSYQVGDVREEYRSSFISQIFSESALATLNRYVSRSFTINVGGSDWFPDYESRGWVGEVYD